MKFDTAKLLVDRLGKPVWEPEIGIDGKIEMVDEDNAKMRNVTHGDVAVRAIDATVDEEDRKLSREVIHKRNILATRIMGGGVVELSKMEANLICDRVCVFGAQVAGEVASHATELDNVPCSFG